MADTVADTRARDLGDPGIPPLRSAGLAAVAREAGAAVTAFRVRRQFIDGDTVCSIIDWEMAMLPGQVLTSAEILEVRAGEIVRGELIYDAESLRQAMAAAATE